jgi:hypothetical protein
MTEVKVYDGQDEVQLKIAKEWNAKKAELDRLGNGILKSLRRHKLKKEVSKLAREYDAKALELGKKARYSSGSHG